jgi:ferredoxin
VKNLAFAHNGKTVEVRTSANVLQALLAEQVPVIMACGGKGLCATCHVYIERGADALTPRTKKEDRTLSLLAEADSTSRLACQAQVCRDGVVVRLPKGLYIEKSSDLTTLIGRRTDSRVLHPITGKVLVEEGKIITRSVVEKLTHVEADMRKMLADSRSV